MYMTMTMMRPGLFSQREGPGSEPGNSQLCPDEAARSVCGVFIMLFMLFMLFMQLARSTLE